MSLFTKRSFVWEFFEPQVNDQTKAKCKLCDCILSRGGIGKRATTTSLVNHIKNKHPKDYSEIDLSKENNSDAKDASLGPKAVNQGVKRKQVTLEGILEKKKLWDINDQRAIKLHKIIGEMIACDNQPFSFVEDMGFIKLMRETEPRYKVPCRNYFQGTVLPSMYEDCKEKISSLLATAEEISLTSDIWTSSVNNHSFISVTGHWISNDFIHYDAVISAKYFPGSHTGEAISEIIQKVCKEWNLNKIHLVLRDGASNIVKGLYNANIKSEWCFLHLLHLVVTDALSSQRSIKDLIAIAKRIVGHFNHSSLACSRLKDIQIKKLGIQEKKLVQDVSTRWNSTFYMLERLNEQKSAVSLYTAEYGDITNLTGNQWMLLENLLNLLRPFEAITKEVSSTKCLISVVIPMIKTMKLYLSKSGNDFFGVGTIKDVLIENLDKRFSSFENNDNYIIATTLDPRFKLAFFNELGVEDEEEVRIKIKRKLVSIMETMDVNFAVNKTISDVSVTDKKDKDNKKPSSFWDCFSEIKKASLPSMINEEDPTDKALEVKCYFNKPLIARMECPLNWWKTNGENFPILANVAKKYLSAPASTVYSERLFSEAGNIYEIKRNRILPENAEKLLFLHHNFRLYNDK